MSVSKRRVIDDALGAHAEDPELLPTLFSLVFDIGRGEGHIAATAKAIEYTNEAIRLVAEDE